MAFHLIRKLEQFTRLSSDDKRILEQAASLKVRRLGSREDIFREGDKPRHINLILDGWACRYKVLEDGRRQITALLIPGDLCDVHMFILTRMDHSVGAITPLSVAEIPTDTILEITHGSARLSRAFWWNSLVEEAIAREWVTNLGQREAIERVAHLFCELFLRLRSVGMTNSQASCPSFELPVTQEQLADATGMSTVHVNRTIQEMRERGLIVWKGKTVTIPDLEALQDVALFNANYLHLDHAGQAYDANEP
ncbi:CRP-like cAMP-binding protein [Microvirga lupini]|uniref:CRP-like cAMP-binding protein n=1 Tax=Microvirga lupini TaxID=420324 RepID=A0A7W4YX55_9HYPH|nr:Crp/Fnr family transcriptional regulator [Microvirga lupini]MBB3018623.1 CRP-like cAMP-binding protein [Microvirga lupini]